MVKVARLRHLQAITGEGEPAPRTGDAHRHAGIFGSPLYMSPEQLKSAADVDARTDIWALGVILYELITGHRPFDRPTVPETFGAILFEQPKPLAKLVKGVPDGLEQIIAGCLAKDRDARLGNVGALAKALFPYAASGSRASLERTSRVLRRAGLTLESVAPPSLDGGPSKGPRGHDGGPSKGPRGHDGGPSKGPPNPPGRGGSQAAAQSGSQTPNRVGHGEPIPGLPAHPRSRMPIVAGVVAGVIFAASAGFFWFKRTRPAPAAVVPVIAEAPVSPGHGPPPVVTATPSVVQAPVAPAPSATAVATVVSGPMPSAPLRGKLPSHKGKPGAPASTGAPTAAPAPPKPPEDDFNDRK